MLVVKFRHVELAKVLKIYSFTLKILQFTILLGKGLVDKHTETVSQVEW